MKKILNWTFGGFFRAFGRILCFLLVGGLVAYLIASNGLKLPDILSFGIIRVKADTIDYTYKQYRIQYYSLGTGTSAWTSNENMNTSIPLSSGYGVSAISPRFGYSSKFKAGKSYRFTIEVSWQPGTVIQETALNVDSTNCLGTLTTSNWDSSATRIDTCTFIGASKVANIDRVRYVYDVVPSVDVEGIQFNIYLSGTSEVSSVNVRTTSTIITGEDVSGAINEQTIIIQDEFNDLSNTIIQNNQNLINSITEQNQVCSENSYVYNSSELENGQILSNGNVGSDTSMKHTDYIEINQRSETFNEGNWPNAQTGEYFCLYDNYKTKTRCFSYNTYYSNNKFLFNQFNENEKYIRLTLWNNANNRGTIYVKTCKNGNQELSDELHSIGKGIHDNDTSEATSEASDFFNSFSTNTHGLTSIITAPLNAITSLNSSSCTPLHLPIPYLENKYIDLPCMRAIYDENFGGFMNLYDTIIFGIVSYWIIVRIFTLVKDFKNPEHDEIEVVDL